MTNEELGPADGVTAEWELEKQKQQVELDLFKIALEKERLLATQQLDLLKAQQDAIAGLIPTGEAKPLEGKIEADEKFGFVAELVAYDSLKGIAKQIVDGLKSEAALPNAGNVLIVDDIGFAVGGLSLAEVESQISSFETSLAKQIGELGQMVKPVERAAAEELGLESFPVVPMAAATVIPQLAVGALSATADIVGFFKTDYSIKGREFDINKLSLIASVAGKLHTPTRKIFIEDFYELEDSPIVSQFDRLQKQSIELRALRNQLSTRDGSSDGAKSRDSGGAEALIAASDALLTAFDSFSKSVVTAGENEARPKIAEAALRSKIEMMEITHLLYLDVLTSGGEAITKKSTLRSGETSFVGGAAACYILATSVGSVIASDTVAGLSAIDYELSGKSKNTVRRIPFGNSS